MGSYGFGANGGRNFSALIDTICQDISSMKAQGPAHLITVMTYSISLFSSIRIGIEAGIFRTLAASEYPITLKDLAQKLTNEHHKTDDIGREEFIARMLRALCGLKLADEAGPYIYQANELTRTMADPGFEAGWVEMYDNSYGPNSTMSHMLTWVREHGYKAPDDATDGAFQRARGIVGRPTFQHWAQYDPTSLSHLSAWMKRIQIDRLNWSEWFPADALFDSSKAGRTSGGEDGVFMVDVGGGLGHDLNGFAARYPDRKMRLINQDLPEVIGEAKAEFLDWRIELFEHDFFTPQPVKGADIYFMHKIIHDWPDKECILMLTHLRDAMASHSRLFLNDAILPDQGGPLLLAAFDMTMLVQLSGKERSESMWKRLISEVGGLSIRKFWQAPELKGEGIVEVVKET